MRKSLATVAACTIAFVAGAAAEARPLHARHGSSYYGRVHYRVAGTGYGRAARFYPPLAGTVGTPVPRSAARFMGYPYNVPGYRYEYGDACLLRVGGVFGPGPSITPCPFGLNGLF